MSRRPVKVQWSRRGWIAEPRAGASRHELGNASVFLSALLSNRPDTTAPVDWA